MRSAARVCSFRRFRTLALPPQRRLSVSKRNTLDPAHAEHRLGRLHANGEGEVPQDLVWLRSKGHAQAQFDLGLCCATGQGVEQDFTEAARMWRLAANQGVVEAQFRLGQLFLEGDGVPQNVKEAARLYRLPADKGLVPAQFNLGLMYYKGQNADRDAAEAMRLFQLASEQGLAQAQFALGSCYALGKRVPQDCHKAVRLLRLAAEQGLAEGMPLLGKLCFNGMGVPKDIEEAAKWWRLAVAQGDLESHILLAQYHHEKGELSEEVRMLRLAAERGNPHAQFRLGSLYHNGVGVDKDVMKAQTLYRLAADQGYARGQLALGILFSEGDAEVPKNLPEAARFFRLAAQAIQMHNAISVGAIIMQ